MPTGSWPQPRYGAFMDCLARDSSKAQRVETAAGLLVLRAADIRLSGYAPSAGLLPEREAVAALPDSCTSKPELLSLLDAIDSSRAPFARRVVLSRKWKYARRLEFQAAFRRAVDVYETLLSAFPPNEERRRTTCLIRIALAQKWAANCHASRRAYVDARARAARANDIVARLRAEIGLAELAYVRGNLPKASRSFAALMRQARRYRAKPILGRALHGFSNVAYFRHEYHTSLRFAHRALRLIPAAESRNRVWADIGLALIGLGRLQLAREVYGRLLQTTQQQLLQWGARHALLEIAARQRDAREFHRYESQLLEWDPPPYVRAYIYESLAEGYRQLGNATMAREYFGRASALATEHGISQLAVETRTALGSRMEVRSDIPIPDALLTELAGDLVADARRPSSD